MIQNELYLVHHGILGQKWGKKNGPPYPLDYKKLSPEEREEAKKSAIERGDVKEAQANRRYYSNQEINDVINRFQLEKRLAEISAEHVKTGMDKLQDLSKNMGTISDAVSKGSSLYNNTAKVINAFGGKELPIIGESKNKDNKDTKDEKPKKTFSFTDKASVDKIVKESHKYSDEELSEMAKRAKNLSKVKNAFGNNNDDDDDDDDKKKK